MENKYYLPISSTSLAHYFGCACIKPSKYFDNKQEDLQDKFNDFLLVTTHFGTRQTDCCLELVFTTQETSELINIKNGFYLYEKPLPITRVRKIYFSSKERKEQTITNINMSTAFVPDGLVEVKEFDSIQVTELDKPQDIHIVPYSEPLKRFNGFLGGLALMRLAGEEYMNYSENYFATLAFFNTTIQQNLEYSKINIDIRYRGAFTGESGFQKIIPYLNKMIDETDINNIAQEENQVIKKDKITRVIDLNVLDKWTYTVAVLNTYGVGSESKKKKIDELILSNFKSEIKPGKSEGIALCYGINRGYSAFLNKYSLGKNEKIVKFQLNSQLDYYTIESLYQYAFNNSKSDKFPYLDWCPKFKNIIKTNNTNYQILDVVVIGKKKADILSPEGLESLFQYFENLFQQLWQKDVRFLFKSFIEKIYNHIKEELEEKFDSRILEKQKEIEDDFNTQIATLQEKVKKLTLENQLLSEKNTTKSNSYSQQHEEVIYAFAEPQAIYYTKNDIKEIIELSKEKGKKAKDEAKSKGINVKDKDIEEIIMLLMTTQKKETKTIEKDLFENE